MDHCHLIEFISYIQSYAEHSVSINQTLEVPVFQT